MHIQKINIKNQVYNYHFDNLVKTKQLETKKILIDKKNYKDLTIDFTRYVHSKSIKIFSLQYHELTEKKLKTWKKTYLMVNNYMLQQY